MPRCRNPHVRLSAIQKLARIGVVGSWQDKTRFTGKRALEIDEASDG